MTKKKEESKEEVSLKDDVFDPFASASQEERDLLLKIRELKEDLSPKEEEEKKSEDKEFTDDELMRIFDALITQGTYQETFRIGNRIVVTWKSRTTKEANAILRIVDAAGFNTMMAIQNHTNALNMAYSLVNYNGKEFIGDGINSRHDFILGLPEILIISLAQTLAKFDYKISKAVEVGRENF